MPFFGKKKEDKPTEAESVAKSSGFSYNTETYTAWRSKYDQDRDQAVKEGRSCGRCIEGIVWFGPTDQAPCNCELAKKDEPEVSPDAAGD